MKKKLVAAILAVATLTLTGCSLRTQSPVSISNQDYAAILDANTDEEIFTKYASVNIHAEYPDEEETETTDTYISKNIYYSETSAGGFEYCNKDMLLSKSEDSDVVLYTIFFSEESYNNLENALFAVHSIFTLSGEEKIEDGKLTVDSNEEYNVYLFGGDKLVYEATNYYADKTTVYVDQKYTYNTTDDDQKYIDKINSLISSDTVKVTVRMKDNLETTFDVPKGLGVELLWSNNFKYEGTDTFYLGEAVDKDIVLVETDDEIEE